MQPQPEYTNCNHNIKSNSNSNNSQTAAARNKRHNKHNKKQQQQQKQQQQTNSDSEQLPEEGAIAPIPQQQQYQSVSCTNTKSASDAKAKQQQKIRPRIIKSKQPLVNFRFYLDIVDHQQSKRIEELIKYLGATQEFFLNTNVTHFITDKSELPANVLNGGTVALTTNAPQTPKTPQTPIEGLEQKNAQTPTGKILNKGPQTRTDAILIRARLQGQQTAVASNTTTANTPTSLTTLATTPTAKKLDTPNKFNDESTNYTVWTTDYVLRFFKIVQNELKPYLKPELQTERQRDKVAHKKSGGTHNTGEAIPLKGSFIKVESIKRNCRPYYQLFRKPDSEWPKIDLNSNDGAFRLNSKKPPNVMTRKSRSRNSQCATPLPAAVQALRKQATPTTSTRGANSNTCRQAKESSDKQCGVCEICKIEYDTLTIHLKTKDHEYFAKNAQNFLALDTLINSSADVKKFLNNDLNGNNDLQEMEVDDTDLPLADINDQDPLSVSANSSSKQLVSTPSPLLREKSKRSTKGKHSSEKFQVSPPVRKKSITKKSTNLSSPVRTLMPTSSLYKVVESTPLDASPRRTGLLTNAVANQSATASPSLIVKFKKVRTTELNRLNGEAESFMFPTKPPTVSSDLPTDTDRNTSSEQGALGGGNNCSSTSLESSECAEDTSVHKRRGKSLCSNKKNTQQSFQSTPIQPATQLLKRSPRRQQPQRQQKSLDNSLVDTETDNSELSPPSAAAAIVAATAKITLPAATRKSSRTATAIVSAATTSSRLLRAAAEVVKKSSNKRCRNRKISVDKTNDDAASVVTTAPVVAKQEEFLTPTNSLNTSNRLRSCRLAANAAIVKMEDRMGDDSDLNTDENFDESVKLKTNRRKTVDVAVDDDDDDDVDCVEDDEDDDDDDAADKDFKYKFKKTHAPTFTSGADCVTMRRRENRRSEFNLLYTAANIILDATSKTKKKSLVKAKNQTASKRSTPAAKAVDTADAEQLSPPTTTVIDTKSKKKNTHTFDFSKSERINELSYAFERVPCADLWYRVYKRQDTLEENYFEYYGSTQYRKLPYELGPIPTLNDNGVCCKLCEKKNLQSQTIEIKPEPIASASIAPKNEEKPLKTTATTTEASTNLVDKPKYTLKHKKLHLLQRYRQEQEALKKQQQQQQQHQEELLKQNNILNNCQLKDDINDANSKTASPERGERTRESSTSSSCASSIATNATKKPFRNKLLNKAAYLSMELASRKSPREHASTLALVSCLIKQRHESKSNSDVEENVSASTTPTPATHQIKDENSTLTNSIPTTTTPTPTSPHKTRSAAATPIEEMCFATEISENVKRMRRGRNKYDHSPPYVHNANTTSRRLARQKIKSALLSNNKPKQLTPKHRHRVLSSKFNKNNNNLQKTSSAGCLHSKTTDNFVHNKGVNNLPPSIRKTGQKKGVLEFEVDAVALENLKASLQPVKSVRKLEQEIDEFLERNELNLDIDMELDILSKEIQQQQLQQQTSEESKSDVTAACKDIDMEQTPPATDYFSSDFDLCDLINNPENCLVSNTTEEPRQKSKPVNLFNAMALNTYFRKRKYMKSNRTGWPKVQKKKYSMRHQAVCTLFEKQAKSALNSKQNVMEVEQSASVEQTQDTVITPPDSESDAALSAKKRKLEAEVECEPLEETKETIVEAEADEESIAETTNTFQTTLEVENEDTNTMEDMEVEDEVILDEDEKAVEADDEDEKAVEGDDEDEKAVEADDEEELPDVDLEPINDDIETCITTHNECNGVVKLGLTAKTNILKLETDEYISKRKCARRNSSLGKALANCLNAIPVDITRLTVDADTHADANANADAVAEEESNNPLLLAATSSPSAAHTPRSLRRTPQLNGSLVSCNSPSERAGDNSDIFTVSSDGLDTDLDMSNPHDQNKLDEPHACTKKASKTKRYDITKYVPNPAAHTCAAEAATAAAKSLAIAQFLKKEVRVTCRRIRAPFRRIRYRR